MSRNRKSLWRMTPRRQRGAYCPRLEFLESRLQPGDTVLGGLLGPSLLGVERAILEDPLASAGMPGEALAASQRPASRQALSISDTDDFLKGQPATDHVPEAAPAKRSERFTTFSATASSNSLGGGEGGVINLPGVAILADTGGGSGLVILPGGLTNFPSRAAPPVGAADGLLPALATVAANVLPSPAQPVTEATGKTPPSDRTAPPAPAADPALAIPERPDEAQVRANYGQLPLSFEINQGQANAAVHFLSRGGGYNLFLTSNEAVLSLRRPTQQDSDASEESPAAAGVVLRMQLLGANESPTVVGREELPGRVNYYIGNDPSQWHTEIPTYARVEYQGVYEGINLIYYGNQQKLEYDFVVTPGADPGVIRMNFQGADRLEIDERGDLLLHTADGPIRQSRPITYQEIDGVRKEIVSKYVIDDQGHVGFRIGAYDPGRILVIDPNLLYSSYLGGPGRDVGNGIDADIYGNAYVTGQIELDYPIGMGTNPPTSGIDAFVAKVNPTGTQLIYTTYLGGTTTLGGTGVDIGYGISVNHFTGDAFITGSTNSRNFPTTAGAFQMVYGGGLSDAFVVRLDPTGALSYATFFGQAGRDVGYGIDTTIINVAVVTGFATPVLSGTPTEDVFVAMFNPTGGIMAARILGGSGTLDRADIGRGIAIDFLRVDPADPFTGEVYVTGTTSSSNFNGLAPALYNGGPSDAFVTRVHLLNPGFMEYTSFIGTPGQTGSNGRDEGFGIAVDRDRNAYVTGSLYVNSTTRIDAFVQKRSPAGAVVWTQTLGGLFTPFTDVGRGIAVDYFGNNVYVTGATFSPDFILTANAFQLTYGGDQDAFVARLDANDMNPATRLRYSTYLGGNGSDAGYGIAVLFGLSLADPAMPAPLDLDAAPEFPAYVTGFTNSEYDFPTTQGVFQQFYGGGPTDSDAFVTHLPTPTGEIY